MKNYSPAHDALWLFSVALFALNKYWIKPNFDGWFWHSSLNDVLCLPVWMPVCVWVFAKLKLRDNAPPRPLEIAVCLLFWSCVFEIWLPQTDVFGQFAPGDPLDVAAYSVGGLVGWIWWNFMLRSGHDLQRDSTGETVDVEVGIERKNARGVQRFGGDD